MVANVAENQRVVSAKAVAAFFRVPTSEVGTVLGDSLGPSGLFSCQTLWLRLVSGHPEGLADLESRLTAMRLRGSALRYRAWANRAAV